MAEVSPDATCADVALKSKPRLEKGDYVLASKYRDGDPFDGWAVGFFDGMLRHDRFMVVDGDGKQYRHNGFRRCERVSAELGEWFVVNRVAVSAITRISPINLWRFRFAKYRAELEAMRAEPELAAQCRRIARETPEDLRQDEREAFLA